VLVCRCRGVGTANFVAPRPDADHTFRRMEKSHGTQSNARRIEVQATNVFAHRKGSATDYLWPAWFFLAGRRLLFGRAAIACRPLVGRPKSVHVQGYFFAQYIEAQLGVSNCAAVFRGIVTRPVCRLSCTEIPFPAVHCRAAFQVRGSQAAQWTRQKT
jgi:hypothetical protein